MIRGTGTVLNVLTVLGGAGLGSLIGERLPERVRSVVTDALGLVTVLLAGLDAAAVNAPALRHSVGGSAPVLIVLGALVIGGGVGAALRLQERLDRTGDRLVQLARAAGPNGLSEGFVLASLLFCVGPLTILGSLQDGLGHGISLLAVKSALDGFAALAFAASYGAGVALAAGTVGVVQGALTAAAAGAGSLLTAAQISALTATGGLLLAGVGLRLLRARALPVVDLLPALLLAPGLASLAAALH